MSKYGTLCAAIGLTVADAAWADGGSGAACGPWTWHDMGDYDNPILSFDPRGVLNGSPTDFGEMTCGFVRQWSTSPYHVYIDYRDNDSSYIACTVRMLSWSGEELWSATDWTYTGGYWTGYGYFMFTIPAATTGYGSIDCSIPPFQPGDINPSMVYGFSVE